MVNDEPQITHMHKPSKYDVTLEVELTVEAEDEDDALELATKKVEEMGAFGFVYADRASKTIERREN